MRSEEILKEVLKLSVRQTELAQSESFEELLECQAVRVELFRELKELGGARNKALAAEIIESDSKLAGIIEKSAGELKSRLERIGKGARVAKAYASS
jgi:flagellar protein FliT